MLTRSALKNLLNGFRDDLAAQGFRPQRMVLYGSYANGNPHQYSDVDVAVWSPLFKGRFDDFEKAQPVLKNYPLIQAKLYPADADENNFDPFIEEINRTGVRVL